MKEKIVLVGGGGHCKVVIDALSLSGRYDISGILDANLASGSKVLGVTVLGGDELLKDLRENGIKNAFVSVGSVGDYSLREKLYEKIKTSGFDLPAVIHPAATVSKDVMGNIGEGTFVAASATINPGTVIGRNVIINTSSSIDHDCRIGDFVHIAPGVVLGGGVEVGRGTHIGAGAVVVQYRTIGKDCFVKAKERVSVNIPDGKTYPREEISFSGAGPGKIFVIAEIGVNHNGDLGTAKRMIDAAKGTGADAVKFQSFRSENIVSRSAPKAEYQKRSSSDLESQLEMLKKYEIDENGHKELMKHCEKAGISFLSAAFDVESAGMLYGMGLRVFKIPSGELTNLPLLRKIGNFGGKVIISTGMATFDEVGEALDALVKSGTGIDNIAVLHCNTAYPTPMEDVNLKAMVMIRKKLGVSVGYSDHTLGTEISIAAAAMGAVVIEKHFTLDRGMEGPDHGSSLEPEEFKSMVKAIRNVEKAISLSGEKYPSPSEKGNIDIVRKRIVALRDIRAGEILSEENITVKRSPSGISPMKIDSVMGTVARKDFRKDEGIEI